MGAWGSGIYENDEALDFIEELKESSDAYGLMEKTLQEVYASDYIEVDAGGAGLVVADIIVSVLNHSTTEIENEDLQDWLETNKSLEVQSLKELALLALEKILGEESELNQLWEENEEEYPTWREQVENLARNLKST